MVETEEDEQVLFLHVEDFPIVDIDEAEGVIYMDLPYLRLDTSEAERSSTVRIDTLSTFPMVYDSVMGECDHEARRHRERFDFHAHDLRDWTRDRHRTTDDDPYGGGQGLVMKCEPIFEAYDDIVAQGSARPTPSSSRPAVSRSTQGVATELSEKDRLLFICGHYEGHRRARLHARR